MSASTKLPTISTGAYTITAHCPECDGMVRLPGVLSAVLTIDSESGNIRVKLTTKKVDHNCGVSQATLFGTDDAAGDSADDSPSDES